MKQTTFNDVHRPECTTRRYGMERGDSWVGHTLVYIDCPFCYEETEAYLWSLCGGGKRCANPDCGAIFGGWGIAHNLTENINDDKKRH